MATEGNSRTSEQDRATGTLCAKPRNAEAIAAIKERMVAKSKGTEWKPLPRRGDVKKRILKDIKDTLKGCVPASENSRVAADGSVSFEEDGLP